MTLNDQINREISKLRVESVWFSNLPISEKWKALFFSMSASRGFRKVSDYRTQMIEIAQNETEVVLLLAENKIIGIDRLHDVATRMGPQCQVDYYQAVKNSSGVKSVEAERIWNLCFGQEDRTTLFTGNQ